MTRPVPRIVGLAVLGCFLGVLFTQAQFGPNFLNPGGSAPALQVTNYWSATAVRPGGDIVLGVVLDIRPPYHINYNKAQEPFIPTTIELISPPTELQSSTPVFPQATEVQVGTDKIHVFSGHTVIYIPMKVLSSAKPGKMPIEVKVSYQACDEKSCLQPRDVFIQAKLPVLSATAEVRPANPEIFEGMKALKEEVSFAFFGWDFKIESSKFGLLWLLAALGGVLLNFTPCVLPLIPIKVMGLSQAAGNRKRCVLLGLTLSAGVVTFWLALALAVCTISGFNTTNKLFQYPAFTISVGVIIVLMAVGMCGLFAVRLPQWVYRVNPSQESVPGSFLFGIMTAVLSTPCTAPFMGAAAAWAAVQKPAITLITFAVIGIGMALPYLLLSAFPGLVHRMPRTGPASELIKQIMGLLMLGAGTYFLGTGLAGLLAKPPDPPSDAYWWVVGLFVIAAGVWLLWRTVQITPRLGKRLVFGAVAAVLVLLGIEVGVQFTKRPVLWVYFTPERFADAQRQRKVIVLEFTAAWCLNCHALEKGVLHSQSVVPLLNSKDVVPIKVDLTGNNIPGNDKLVEVGRRTIPYLLVYARDGRQLFASDAYTVQQLTDVLRGAVVQTSARSE